MKETLKRLARNKLTWVILASLLAAAGINLPPQVLDALPVVGPLLIE